LAAQRTQAKREKIKIKKHELHAGDNLGPAADAGAKDKTEKKTRVQKRVSFA